MSKLYVVTRRIRDIYVFCMYFEEFTVTVTRIIIIVIITLIILFIFHNYFIYFNYAGQNEFLSTSHILFGRSLLTTLSQSVPTYTYINQYCRILLEQLEFNNSGLHKCYSKTHSRIKDDMQ